jgi:hypothetical protein
MMKKKRVVMLFCLVLMILCLCSCGNKSDDNSIIGKWSVTAYELNGEVVSKDDVGEYMGETFASIERPMLLFQESGLVRVYKSGDKEEYTVNYKVTDTTIELYKDGEHVAYLEIDGDVIRMETDSENIVMIYTKE